MLAKQSKFSVAESDLDCKSDGPEWIKGLRLVHQIMYIAQEYKQDNGFDSDNQVNTINPDALEALKKKAKRQKNNSGVVEKYAPPHCVSVQKEEKF